MYDDISRAAGFRGMARFQGNTVYVVFYGKSELPGFLGILAHAQMVCTRLSFPPMKESLGLRLVWYCIMEAIQINC